MLHKTSPKSQSGKHRKIKKIKKETSTKKIGRVMKGGY